MTKKVHFTAILLGLLSAIVPAFGVFGRNGLDVIEHGPVMGVRFHW